MRAALLLSLTASFAHAIPGGRDGQGRQGGPPPGRSNYGHGDYSHDQPEDVDCEPSAVPEVKYTKTPELVYSTPEPVYTKPPKPEYTKPTSTFTCPTTCRLDFHGTFLQYPTVIVYTPVYSQTINAFVTEFGDGSPGQTAEETITAPAGEAAAPLTWTAFGVELTYPTTYVAYTSIAFETIIPLIPQSTCASTSAPLQFPRVWPSLIADSTSIRQPGSLPPATIVEWVNSLPTVREQLGGHICDPVFGGLAPFVPTATVTSATTIDGNTRIVQTTTVSVAAVTPPTPSTTTPPPPPSTTSQSLVLQTVNAAVIPRRAGPGTWFGNVLAALLLAL